ncbi:MAG: thioredoxin family protein [Planctomycetes bacterium]|nr:thioredoxin family protein [Planctomycetota bacterium]
MVNVSDSESAVAEESGGKKEEGADAPQPAPAPAAPSDAAPEKATINKAAPAFTLTDHTGKAHTLADYKGKTVVLEWINYDCPIVRKHYDGGNMQALQKKYTEKGVVWLCVNSSAKGKQGYFEGDKLKERIEKEKGSQTAYLLDTKGAVGRAYGAKATPHMYVITAEGVLVYMGAIDSIPSGKKEDIAKATNYVDAALTAVLAGKPVEKQVTEAYGCAVKY